MMDTGENRNTHRTQLTADGGILNWPVGQFEISLCLHCVEPYGLLRGDFELNKLHLHDNEVL